MPQAQACGPQEVAAWHAVASASVAFAVHKTRGVLRRVAQDYDLDPDKLLRSFCPSQIDTEEQGVALPGPPPDSTAFRTLDRVHNEVQSYAGTEVHAVLARLAQDLGLDEHELAHRYCPEGRKGLAQNAAHRASRRKLQGVGTDVVRCFRELRHSDGRVYLVHEATRDVYSAQDPATRVGIVLADGSLLLDAAPPPPEAVPPPVAQ